MTREGMQNNANPILLAGAAGSIPNGQTMSLHEETSLARKTNMSEVCLSQHSTFLLLGKGSKRMNSQGQKWTRKIERCEIEAAAFTNLMCIATKIFEPSHETMRELSGLAG